MGWPSLVSRTSPMKLATAPTSRRPFVSASSSRPASKSSAWIRMKGTLTSGHRREERDLVPRLDRRREVRHVLVHGDAKALVGRERVGPLRVAITQLGDEHRDRGYSHG